MSAILSNSAEWRKERLGHVTASRVADVVAKTKTGYSASRATYMGQLLAERLSGVPMDGYSSAAMQWGLATEAQALSAYAFLADQEISSGSFIRHPALPWSGATPDGLVGDKGLVEIKCPNTNTHLDTLLTGTIPGKYQTQMLWQMACTSCDWVDFFSFDPRLPEDLRVFTRRLHRDEERITELEAEVAAFLGELESLIGKLSTHRELAA